ncbi:protein N-lysine methyltransferase METTL21A isoform X1 [Carex littledalei]|uniref:Protein N-lysine methyltransferase METTL21A isoform X1 n=1 Tax=Carex littledalei TaxID=544730 RepID=A0A833QJ31_9POAL|nr:protein N-lysine methyltransferase METTL21A isoform X1 [Carex littledalei]
MEEHELEPPRSAHLGAYAGEARLVESAEEEVMLLWGLGQPTSQRHNAFVRQSSHTLSLDCCARRLTLLQSPSSMSTPGVTGAVMWDSGVVLAKFLEHAVDFGQLSLKGTRVVELGAGCGLAGIVAALLGAEVVLTDLSDRLKLLKKNVDANFEDGPAKGSARVSELTWGDEIDSELVEPIHPDFVIGSDVIYCEAAVNDLLITLKQLCGPHTTILLAGELRNDAVVECFLEAALEDFTIGCIDQQQWHPDFRSNRVSLFVMVKKVEASTQIVIDF